MASKSLHISEKAYESLEALKEPDETFSNVILRVTSKYAMRQLVGLLSEDEAEKLRANIKEARSRSRRISL